MITRYSKLENELESQIGIIRNYFHRFTFPCDVYTLAYVPIRIMKNQTINQ